MTRRFRTGLFISLAAAVGLHLRPCLVCVSDCDGPVCQPDQDATPERVVRPSITAMLTVGAPEGVTRVR